MTPIEQLIAENKESMRKLKEVEHRLKMHLLYIRLATFVLGVALGGLIVYLVKSVI